MPNKMPHNGFKCVYHEKMKTFSQLIERKFNNWNWVNEYKTWNCYEADLSLGLETFGSEW